jgi:YD repeat-containing protein
VSYADASTIQYTYDAGDRLTQVVDSIGGTISRVYDGLDRLASETTPQGTVSYTYAADDCRASMTVAGQTAVTYGHDAAHRLTSGRDPICWTSFLREIRCPDRWSAHRRDMRVASSLRSSEPALSA